jgi:hypothetical protein
MNPLAVLEEWMYAYPAGKKQTWFSREADKPIYFSTKLLGDNRAIERLTRPNSLFLSAAAQNNHEALSVIYRWFSNSLSFVTGERSATRSLAKVLHSNAGLRQRLARSLSLADLGITDLVVKDLSAKDFGEKLTSLLNKQNRSDRAFTLDEARREIQFLHRIGDSTQPFNESQESKVSVRATPSILGPGKHDEVRE